MLANLADCVVTYGSAVRFTIILENQYFIFLFNRFIVNRLSHDRAIYLWVVTFRGEFTICQVRNFAKAIQQQPS